MKTTWRRTGVDELKNANISTRNSSTSQITLYRSNKDGEEEVRNIANLAAHSVRVQDRRYNYSNKLRQMVDAKEILSNLRHASLAQKIENWQM